MKYTVDHVAFLILFIISLIIELVHFRWLSIIPIFSFVILIAALIAILIEDNKEKLSKIDIYKIIEYIKKEFLERVKKYEEREKEKKRP